MEARLLRGQVVLLRSRHRMEGMARVRVERFDQERGYYEGIQLGQGYKPGVTVLPPLRAFRGARVAAVRTGQGFQFVLPGVV
ncbi:MAG: hypothetical protein RDU24_08915 [Humidesulfovibrio sp.]|uniref:hypothetical protein n=1 Tax=Humidesulfovibrio sp. TaxID=2910988 RepID=UPI0027F14538|nr:hypothetical protein [Humidesulfovibrio sp.]MDQ7835489.1 hypothetical protein [Humidesulfovibrio sp.]